MKKKLVALVAALTTAAVIMLKAAAGNGVPGASQRTYADRSSVENNGST